jgi:hypothetical protein
MFSFLFHSTFAQMVTPKTELEQDLIDNSRQADDPRTNGLFSTLAALNRAASRTAERDLNNALRLNHDLMWTWFLPNPLWSPNKSKWNW